MFVFGIQISLGVSSNSEASVFEPKVFSFFHDLDRHLMSVTIVLQLKKYLFHQMFGGCSESKLAALMGILSKDKEELSCFYFEDVSPLIFGLFSSFSNFSLCGLTPSLPL